MKRAGDVFLATGGIVGGIVFIFFPTTSLLTYPAVHLVSVHSFIFHGIMVYLGFLINKTHYVELNTKDIKYYVSLVGIVCAIAYVINLIFGSNLMFISQNFPGTVIEVIYEIFGKAFTPVMILGQLFLPYYLVYGYIQMLRKNHIKLEANKIKVN